ncbi:hypothetical protein [Marinobacterium arenosum]|uniref:hypothetical protein n=1 Tax=Marinobacterium arenosum TaxID=2862496 RepID=UPI001C97A572|nr:hypothetical protein [Marinobacterium arenosum]MBY4674980.1 hypothetical protein [Marinobacterium arenosum]
MYDCLLEYSDNIQERFTNQELFYSLHSLLCQTLGIRQEEIQGRAQVFNRYLIGNGDEENAFIQLTVRTPSPLDQRNKIELADKLAALLQAEFFYSFQQLHCAISVRIVGQDPTDHIKTLTSDG